MSVRMEGIVDPSNITITLKGEPAQFDINVYDKDHNITHVPMAHAMKVYDATLSDTRNVVEIPFTLPLREYQVPMEERVMKMLLESHVVYLGLPCGWGKTMFSLYIASRLGLPTLILTHTCDINSGWIETIGQVMKGLTPTVINSKTDASSLNVIGIMNVQGIQYLPYELLVKVRRHYKLLILDECLYLLAYEWIHSIMRLTPTYMIGLCAQTRKGNGMHKAIPFLFDKNVIKVKAWVPVEVYFLYTHFVPEPPTKVYYGTFAKQQQWTDLKKSLYYNPDRCEMIARIGCIFSTRKIIILCEYQKQATMIYDMILERGHDVCLYIGSSKGKKGEKHPNTRVMVTTLKKCGIGYDAAKRTENYDGRPFDMAILAADETDSTQAIGRVERSPNPIVLDVVDSHETIKKHRKDRERIYSSRDPPAKLHHEYL